jgi:ATPase family associated with various cellular activities (AAA)
VARSAHGSSAPADARHGRARHARLVTVGTTAGTDAAAPDDGGYPSSTDHLLAELARLDELLRVRIEEVRAGREGAGPPDGSPDRREPAGARPDRIAVGITERVVASRRVGVPLRLVALAQLFGLSPFDTDVVVACLAPEIDGRYERVYAYLHDDPARCAPSVGLLLDVLCPDLDARLPARARFGPGEPLRRHRLVTLGGPPDGHGTTLRGRTVRLAERVARFLLEDDAPDDGLRTLCRVSVPSGTLDELVLPDEVVDRLAVLADEPDDDLVVYLRGGPGVGRRSTAAALCAAWETAMLAVDGRLLAQLPVEELEELLALVDREAHLQGAVLYWSGADELLGPERSVRRDLLLATVTAHPGPTLLGGSARWDPAVDVPVVQVDLPAPGAADRLRLWTAALDGTVSHGDRPDPVELAELATRYRLSGGQIRSATTTANGLAATRGSGVTAADLRQAARSTSNPMLGELAVRVAPGPGWDDLVLPADRADQLREIVDQVRHRAVVHEEWGFAQTGGGLNVLFTGPSGTGKTMAATVLAHTLGLDLYKIDLATVVSKFIGETEKNLSRIFDEAATSNAVLFFDEADALFGKRTQVRDAHDRYANLETSYLLQKLDDHDGVVVLATNLRKNMDEAFVRRLHAVVEFPVPGAADRLRIWQQVWPVATPREAGLDFELLAREVDLPGGNIRNIAVAAAFLAASDGGVVTMAHLRSATRREYQKMGKVVTGR